MVFHRGPAHDALLDRRIAEVAEIRAGKDAALVETMSEAAHQTWRGMMGKPHRWADEDTNEADAIRLGIHAALLAARRHAAAQRSAR